MADLGSEQVSKAVSILHSGDVVGIPTETVYGLAGSILSTSAIEKIFKLKKRPFFDPLIVHISNLNDLVKITTAHDSSIVRKLTNTFWPGPLTIILPKTEMISPIITSGLNTVGIRMPKHDLALRLITEFGTPLAAPSANIFSKTSPTLAQHVTDSFGKDVFVIDGGPSNVGIESTVVRPILNTKTAIVEILRPGIISQNDLIACLGPNVSVRYESSQASPGNIKHHYMPEIPLALINSSSLEIDDKLKELAKIIGRENISSTEIQLNTDSLLAARELYQKLREASMHKVDIIYLRLPKNLDSSWDAIIDRLSRAASYIL